MNNLNLLNHRPGICLALGGGAAKGFAHIGILKTLQKHDIPIAGICGTSVGALIGASFALNMDARVVEEIFTEFMHSDALKRAQRHFLNEADKVRRNKSGFSFRGFLKNGLLFSRSLRTGSMVPFVDFRDSFFTLLPDKGFNQLHLPFFAVAVDLTNHKEVVFDRGLIRSATMASCSIPGVFPPIHAGGVIYVDGGWANKVPVLPLRIFGARYVLAVDVAAGEAGELNSRNGFAIMQQANAMAQRRLQEFQTEYASLNWSPSLEHLHWADFAKITPAIEAGEAYAESRVDEIKQLLDKPIPPTEPKRWWRRIFPRKRSENEMLPLDRPLPRMCIGFEMRGIWEIDDTKMER